MGYSGINYFYNSLGLQSGNCKIHYDFDGELDLSAFIPNKPPSQENSPSYNLSYGWVRPDGNTEVVTGNFYSGYLQVLSPTGFFSKEATFLISQEKTGYSKGTIFSSLQGDQYKSGYAFGINDANKFYFKYNDRGNPIIKTSLKNISDKNAFAVKLLNNTVSFIYYDANQKRIEKESWGIRGNYLYPSDQWYVGTGVNEPHYSYFIDKFIYIDTALPDSYINKIFSGFWSDPNTVTTSSLPYETGQITGYTNVITGITGILGVNYEFSGYRTGTATKEVYQYNILTGNIVSGDTYLEFIGNLPQYCTDRNEQPIYFERTVQTSSTGITGITKTLSGNSEFDVTEPVYEKVYTTGFKYSGQALSPVYNTGDESDLVYTSTTTISENTGLRLSYGMTDVVYLGDVDLNHVGLVDYYEILVHTGGANIDYYNREVDYNGGFGGFTMQESYGSGAVDVFRNGLFQINTGHQVTGQFHDKAVQIYRDYYVSGKRILLTGYAKNDYVLHDIGGTGRVLYESFTDSLTNGVLSDSYDPSGYMFFVSGRKLNYGVDYTGTNNFTDVRFVSAYTGSSESLTAMPYREFQIQRDFGYSFGDTWVPIDIRSENPVLRNSSTIYFNGIKSKREEVYEGASNDLVVGSVIKDRGLSGIFFSDNTNFFYDALEYIFNSGRFSNPLAAYSLRPLDTNYIETQIISGRRGGDNSTSGFYASQITNGVLESWSNLGGGNGYVYLDFWKDQGGSNRDLVQPVLGKQPMIVENGNLITGIGNKPSVYFSGSPCFMYFSGANGLTTTTTEPISCVAVVNKSGAFNNFETYLSFGPNGSSSANAGKTVSFGFPPSGGNQKIGTDVWGPKGTVVNVNAQSGVDYLLSHYLSNWSLQSSTSTGVDIFVNGTGETEFIYGSPNLTGSNTNNIKLGTQDDWLSSVFYDGYISEVICWNKYLINQRNNIESYITNYYNI